MTEDNQEQVEAPDQPQEGEAPEAFKGLDAILSRARQEPDIRHEEPQEDDPSEDTPKKQEIRKEAKKGPEPQPEAATEVPADWQEQLEKKEKRYRDTQRWGLDLSKKLKALEKTVQKYADDGLLSSDEAQALLSSTAHEPVDQEEDHPLLRYGRVWDEELPNIRRYTKDPMVDTYVSAFQALIQVGTRDELQNALTTLEDHKDDPVDLTRAMLEIGKTYNEEVYSDLREAGGIKQLKAKYKKEIEARDKRIDKLEKEKLKYKEGSGYLPSSSYNLPAGGSSEAPSEEHSSIGATLERAKRGRAA